MKKIVLNTYVIRNETGIDIEASVRKFHNNVLALQSHEENDVEAISNAVGVVFDRYPCVSMNTDAVIHAALVEMNVGPEAYQDMTHKVRSYLQANSSHNREDEQLFRSAKGPGGGLCRWSEYVEKAKPTAKK